MRIVYFFILIGIIALIGSCYIKQEYSFDKNFSGTAVSILDMTALSSFAGEASDSADNPLYEMDTLKTILEATTTELKKMKGISNVSNSINETNDLLTISYNFANIDKLNQAVKKKCFSNLCADADSGEEQESLFILKRKKMIYHIPRIESDSLEKSQEQLGEMKSFFTYELVLKFEDKVKDVKHPVAKIGDDGKSVIMESNLFDVFSKDFEPDIEIRFK